MKQSLYFFSFLLIITICFQSCQKDLTEDVVQPNFNTTTEISQRTTIDDCYNFLSNGNFQENTFFTLDNCFLAFEDGLVDSWTNAFGSPHLWFVECQESTLDGVCSEGSDYAFLQGSNENNYTQGIMTNVNLVYDPSICYTLNYEATSPTSTCQTPITFILTSEFESAGVNPPNENNIPVFDPSNSLEINSTNISYGGYSCTYDFNSYGFDFMIDQNYDQLIIYLDISEFSCATVYIDNIHLTCSTKLLQGIIPTENMDCKFSFSPFFIGELNVVEYHWDFGDGNTSDESDPNHNYLDEGIYEVSLTIKDNKGCCTTVTTTVECGNDGLECYDYFCWLDYAGTFDCTNGIRIEDMNGNITDLDFNNPVSIEGEFTIGSDPIYTGYSGIGALISAMDEALSNYGYGGYISIDWADESCAKGSDVLPVIQIHNSNVKVTHIYGNDCQGGDQELMKINNSCD